MLGRSVRPCIAIKNITMKESVIIQLGTIQSELKAPKNQMNKFGGYKYRSAEDILESVKPLLKITGCYLTMSDSMELIGERYYVKATATLTNPNGDSISVCAYAREEETKKGMDASQITGAASSYARKYALNGLFCIDDTKDADFSNTHDKEDVKTSSKKAKKQDDINEDEAMQMITEAIAAIDSSAIISKEYTGSDDENAALKKEKEQYLRKMWKDYNKYDTKDALRKRIVEETKKL